MQSRGYRIIPVNPRIESALGEQAYPNLIAASAAVGPIQLVDVFRALEYIPSIVEDVNSAQDSLPMAAGGCG
jgi:hypothetical protein